MREYALVLLVTAAVTYVLTPLVRRVAIATHAMHEPRARDTHTRPTPLLGGLAMYGGLVAGLLLASRLSFVQDPFRSAGSRSQAGLLLAGGLVVIVGFADDRWGLSAISRLAAQVAAAGILVWSGQALPWLPLPNGGVFSLEPDLSVTLTILLVVVTMNAINFIDGLDGLAAGIVAVAALSFLAYSYTLIRTIHTTSQSLPAVASALLAGMCIGFLPHNFYPARIFMGDIGAMLLGLLLAYGPISSTDSLDPALLTNYGQPRPGPVPHRPAAAGAGRDLHHPVRGPDVRRHPADPGRQADHGRGPAAPASPAAQHRPFLPAERADHVPVGGAVLGHRGLALDRPQPVGRVPRRHAGGGAGPAARHHAPAASLAVGQDQGRVRGRAPRRPRPGSPRPASTPPRSPRPRRCPARTSTARRRPATAPSPAMPATRPRSATRARSPVIPARRTRPRCPPTRCPGRAASPARTPSPGCPLRTGTCEIPSAQVPFPSQDPFPARTRSRARTPSWAGPVLEPGPVPASAPLPASRRSPASPRSPASRRSRRPRSQRKTRPTAAARSRRPSAPTRGPGRPRKVFLYLFFTFS